MSAIPPSWLASGIQGAGAQQRTAEARDREAAAAAARAGGESPFVHELTDAIEANDRDNQVDSEGQGQGGQGRTPSQETERPPPARNDADPGATSGSQIDLQA